MAGEQDPRVLVLAEMRKQTALLTSILAALSGQQQRDTAPTVPYALLEGQYGDPIVKAKSPKDWTGESQQGKPFSLCPPDYLEMVAARLDYFIGKNAEELKKAEKVNDEDAAAKFRKDIKYGTLERDRARGWAARLRAGWTAPTTGRVDETQSEPTW